MFTQLSVSQGGVGEDNPHYVAGLGRSAGDDGEFHKRVHVNSSEFSETG